MKLTYLSLGAFLCAVLFIPVSCSSEPNENTTGSVKISVSVQEDFLYTENSDVPRSQVVHEFYYRVDESDYKPYPHDHVIPDLPVGLYRITVTTDPQETAIPAFDRPYYTGTELVRVVNGKQSNCDIICNLSNAGISFEIDSQLRESGFSQIPVVENLHGKLFYDSQNIDRVGFFKAPDQVTFGFMEGDRMIESHMLEIQPGTLYKILLYKGDKGDIKVDVEIIEVDHPTHNKTAILDRPRQELPVPYPLNDLDYVLLQEATIGNGVHIVFMGDGYDYADINTSKIYEKHIKEGVEEFFSVYPYNTYRNYFTVWMLVGVSYESGVSISADMLNTRFKSHITGSGTEIWCDIDIVWEALAHKSELLELEELTTIMLLNTNTYAGTCYMGPDFSICMCPRYESSSPFSDKRAIVMHEAGGHGFPKLLDEYRYYDEYAPSWMADIITSYHLEGMGMNLSSTDDKNHVPWKDFFNYSKYTELLFSPIGCYEGGWTYEKGIWRPEFNSCMNNNIDYFNAPGRWEIVRRITRLAGIEYSFEQFVRDDNPPAPSYDMSRAEAEQFIPLGKPVLIESRLKY